ncbi:lycopene cyclase domain-containing protein [Natronolimnobius baerhuensis]|uniref:Lycopene cyclase n=1 Tax=Natronolimnobius baerhuensis TaxID=253108 RepID=A0A202E4W6_9EURY|nr:lycopene cyclase domain-containing protein [Natronolimnobius baerhuensis]OVE83295.1 lycopene cyclase [Natronolimnobius baerhuensis]
MRDISVFGRYTYLATELFWGAIAAALLYRANALRKAAVTIIALYPIAYVWDRYTLAVGVFDIKLRTGIEIAGIPLEEHIFMAVVPGLVIGFHETIFGSTESGDDPAVETVR